MNYDNIINHLKKWCRDKSAESYKKYKKHVWGAYAAHSVASEMEDKLSMLLEKDFADTESLKKEIINLLGAEYEHYFKYKKSLINRYFSNRTIREFCDYLEGLVLKKDELPPADIPYSRVIIGDEADALWDKFISIWKYGEEWYWWPLVSDEPDCGAEIFYVKYEYFQPYIKQIKELIGCPYKRMYCHREIFSYPQRYIETVEFEENLESETFFTDKDFTWAIYISHHDTVTFAGSIVPRVKELLINEKDHWDNW